MSGRHRRGALGQATTEYLMITGTVVAAILAGLAFFTTPVAMAFVRMLRRIVLALSS